MTLADFLNPEAIVTGLGTIGVIVTLFVETGLLIGLVLPELCKSSLVLRKAYAQYFHILRRGENYRQSALRCRYDAR